MMGSLQNRLSLSAAGHNLARTAERSLSSPAERSGAGEGDRPQGGGGGIFESEINSLIKLIRVAPSTTLRVVPLPRSAGEERRCAP